MEFKDDLTGVGLVSTLSFLFKFLSGLGCLIWNSGVAELYRLGCLRRASRRRACHCRNVTFYLPCYILGDRHGYRSATWITLYTRCNAFNGKLLVSDATLTIGPAVHSCTMPSRLGATALWCIVYIGYCFGECLAQVIEQERLNIERKQLEPVVAGCVCHCGAHRAIAPDLITYCNSSSTWELLFLS